MGVCGRLEGLDLNKGGRELFMGKRGGVDCMHISGKERGGGET